VHDDNIYVAMNMHWEAHEFELPTPPANHAWHVAVNTGALPPHDIAATGEEPRLDNQNGILVGARSVVVCVGK
jgi:glycogen operon protein